MIYGQPPRLLSSAVEVLECPLKHFVFVQVRVDATLVKHVRFHLAAVGVSCVSLME
jgi:hypothetical protein